MNETLPDIECGVFARKQATWSEFDGLLYGVGIGAGTQDFESELAFTTENSRDVSFKMLPTFGLVLVGGEKEMLDRYGLSENNVLLMSESLRLARDLPSQGAVDIVKRVIAVDDHHAGRVVTMTAEALDQADGSQLFETRSRLLVRDPETNRRAASAADRRTNRSRAHDEPAVVASREFHIPQNQALVYRLSAGRNPLHSDPASAALVGYHAPILHGRCTLGFCVRQILFHHGAPAGHAALSFIEATFAAPVWPNETLVQRFFDAPAAAEGGFEVRRAADDQIVMARGRYQLRKPSD
ncbi:MaoC/PaaZ C-terminal domain-containing protein [Salinisphaera sp. T31B1]|uniref:MaoC/PaaZ C-terminal domain-containing protein n=1 Tax=Salinisphaera sp. T31B1 TaxID=727963 RepID=UPI0033405E12